MTTAVGVSEPVGIVTSDARSRTVICLPSASVEPADATGVSYLTGSCVALQPALQCERVGKEIERLQDKFA